MVIVILIISFSFSDYTIPYHHIFVYWQNVQNRENLSVYFWLNCELTNYWDRGIMEIRTGLGVGGAFKKAESI